MKQERYLYGRPWSRPGARCKWVADTEIPLAPARGEGVSLQAVFTAHLLGQGQWFEARLWQMVEL